VWKPEQMQQRMVKFANLDWSARALLDSALPGCGAQMAPVIGHGMSAERNHLAQVMNAHGFSIEWLKIPTGGSVSMHQLACKQVLSIYQGQIEILIENSPVPGIKSSDLATKIVATGNHQGNDSYAMPAEVWRSYRNAGATDAIICVISAGDEKKRIHWAPSVIQAAEQAGYTVDANGFVGLKRFIDRSQR
jgi:hypothetical protein